MFTLNIFKSLIYRTDTEVFPPLYGVQAKSQTFSPDIQVKLPPLEEIINKLVVIILP